MTADTCSKGNPKDSVKAHSQKKRYLGQMEGEKLDVLFAEFGLPDGIYPRSNFEVTWDGPDATVALNYLAQGDRVFVGEDCTIVAVFPIVGLERDMERERPMHSENKAGY